MVVEESGRCRVACLQISWKPVEALSKCNALQLPVGTMLPLPTAAVIVVPEAPVFPFDEGRASSILSMAAT